MYLRVKLLFLTFLFVSGAQAGPGDETGFVFFGDHGSGKESQMKVSRAIGEFCRSHLCEFGVLLGDNFYSEGVKSVSDSQWVTKFERPYRDLGLVFYPALGNHDHKGNILAQVQYSQRSSIWNMPEYSYTFKKGPVDFFVLDTTEFDSAQARRLTESLRKSQSCWRIVYGHHPVYSYGKHGPTKKLKKRLRPVLRGRADFYLSGHDHDKQVISPPDGVVYVVTGTGGKGTRETKKGKYSLFAADTYGFSHLHIRGEEATLSVVNTEGKVEFQKTFPKLAPSSQCGY